MQKEAATHIAKETQQSYERMAKEFSASRARFWDELAFLAEHIRHDDHVLDIGCGNGRFAPLVTLRHAHYDGLDYSAGLINEAQIKYPDLAFTEGSATALPFSDNSFDIAYAFAVIHHVPSRSARAQFVAEAARVLHPTGKLIITAWDLWSPQYFMHILMCAVQSLLGKNNLDVGDVMLSFGKEKWPRYVHAFTLRELSSLLSQNGFIILGSEKISRKSGQTNIVVVAQKA